MSFYRKFQTLAIAIACAIVLCSTFSTADATATPTQGVPTAGEPNSSVMLTSQTGSIAIGIYLPQQNTSGKAIDAYSKKAGKTPAFAWQPETWQNPDGSYAPFDTSVLEEYRTRGIVPGVTWEPSRGIAYNNVNQPDFSWTQISSGKHDGYITQVAQAAAAYHYPFIVRIFHEMNANWYPWGFGVNGNTNVADFVAAYRHIVDLFRAAGATNVRFVWNPLVYDATFIARAGDKVKQAYPGDNYVDLVGLDGYNKDLLHWRSLQQIFKPSYDFITGLTSRPIILFEVGCVENPLAPTGKANWITQGFLTDIPTRMPAVKAVVWFNSKDEKGNNFTLQTSQNSMNAWQQVVNSPLYQGGFP